MQAHTNLNDGSSETCGFITQVRRGTSIACTTMLAETPSSRPEVGRRGMVDYKCKTDPDSVHERHRTTDLIGKKATFPPFAS